MHDGAPLPGKPLLCPSSFMSSACVGVGQHVLRPVLRTQQSRAMPTQNSLTGARQVRETSRKPDEMYPLLERLSPGTRKLEIFARQHNCQPGWVSLGNQVGCSLGTDAGKDPGLWRTW